MDLSILFLNDVHGYVEPHPDLFYNGPKPFIKSVGGYGALAGYIKTIKKQNRNTLVFDGGDTFHGTLLLIDSKGECLIPVLKKMEIEAMVGHWDFAYGPEQLKRLADELPYPVLGTNVHEKTGSKFLPPYRIIEINGVKVAVIGICCDIIGKTMPDHFSEGLTITDGEQELQETISTVKNENAELIILLSHNGFPQDMHMLSKVGGVDICLSAHTHNRLYEAAKINDTIVIQCGCHGAFIGHLNIVLKDKKITGFNYTLVTMDDSIALDADVRQMVSDIMKPYMSLKQKTVGKTDAMLHRYHTLNSSMDDLLLRALNHVSNTQIAFSNGWRYGAPIPAGPISLWDLYNIIPMNPPVSVVEMSGEEIISMLEKNLERTFSRNPMKQMGGYVKRCKGMTIKMRVENPKGNRIHEAYVGKDRLQRDKVYPVAFVTVQGVPEGIGNNRKNLSVCAVEAMEIFLKDSGTFIPGAKAFTLV